MIDQLVNWFNLPTTRAFLAGTVMTASVQPVFNLANTWIFAVIAFFVYIKACDLMDAYVSSEQWVNLVHDSVKKFGTVHLVYNEEEDHIELRASNEDSSS